MTERARPPQLLRDVLGEVTGRLGIDRAAETGALWARWREIVGDVVADHAEPASLRRGTLTLRVATPSWATEIGYLADEIRGRANAALGAEVVREVRLRTGPLAARTRRRPHAERPREHPTDVEQRVRAEGVPDDPATALERARDAWAKARSRGR